MTGERGRRLGISVDGPTRPGPALASLSAVWPVLKVAGGPGLHAVGVLAHVWGLLARNAVLALLVLESR